MYSGMNREKLMQMDSTLRYLWQCNDIVQTQRKDEVEKIHNESAPVKKSLDYYEIGSGSREDDSYCILARDVYEKSAQLLLKISVQGKHKAKKPFPVKKILIFLLIIIGVFGIKAISESLLAAHDANAAAADIGEVTVADLGEYPHMIYEGSGMLSFEPGFEEYIADFEAGEYDSKSKTIHVSYKLVTDVMTADVEESLNPDKWETYFSVDSAKIESIDIIGKWHCSLDYEEGVNELYYRIDTFDPDTGDLTGVVVADRIARESTYTEDITGNINLETGEMYLDCAHKQVGDTLISSTETEHKTPYDVEHVEFRFDPTSCGFAAQDISVRLTKSNGGE